MLSIISYKNIKDNKKFLIFTLIKFNCRKHFLFIYRIVYQLVLVIINVDNQKKKKKNRIKYLLIQ